MKDERALSFGGGAGAIEKTFPEERSCIQKRALIADGQATHDTYRYVPLFTKWETASANGKLQSTLQWQWPSSGEYSSMVKVLQMG